MFAADVTDRAGTALARVWRLVCICLLVTCLSGTAAYADQTRVAALLDAIKLDEVIAVMREEGLDYGASLGEDMLTRGGGQSWAMMVDRIYDLDRMQDVVRERFVARFGDVDPTPLTAFFNSDTGQQFITFEIDARRAFMDPDVEEAARAAFRAVADDLDGSSPRDIDPQLSAIEAFVEANDLIGFNVMGALNANRLFLNGLAEGGALEMSEAEIMADIRMQVAETEAETKEWIYAFLMLAYAPLSPDQISAYADLSQTREGRALNSALFDAFDAMYGELSAALGMAMAGQMAGEEL